MSHKNRRGPRLNGGPSHHPGPSFDEKSLLCSVSMAVQQGTLAVRPETHRHRRLGDDECARLRGSIIAVGLLHQVLLFDAAVLDGVRRLRVCEELVIEPEFRDVTGDCDRVELARACDGARRQLSTHELALLASEQATARVGGDRRRSESVVSLGDNGLTRDEAAAELGVSRASVARVREVQHPEVSEPVRNELDSKLCSGEISLTKVAEIATASRRAAKRSTVPEGLVDDVGAKTSEGTSSVERVPRILNHASMSSEQRAAGQTAHRLRRRRALHESGSRGSRRVLAMSHLVTEFALDDGPQVFARQYHYAISCDITVSFDRTVVLAAQAQASDTGK